MTTAEKLAIAKAAFESVEGHVDEFDGVDGSASHYELARACSYAAMATNMVANLGSDTPPKDPNYKSVQAQLESATEGVKNLQDLLTKERSDRAEEVARITTELSNEFDARLSAQATQYTEQLATVTNTYEK